MGAGDPLRGDEGAPRTELDYLEAAKHEAYFGIRKRVSLNNCNISCCNR
jgi:hypothetical protein